MTETVGFLAATLTTAAFFPQAWKVYRTKRTEDLSLEMFLLFTAGVALWFWYGVMIASLPVIGANMVTLALSGYILWVKLGNRKRGG